MARYKDGGITHEIDTFLCTSKTTILVRHSESIEDGETGEQLCPYGELLPKNSEFSSRMETTKAHLLFQHVMPAHKFSALRIEEMALENLCSNLIPVEVDRHSLLFLLTCVSLVFLMKFCNVFSLEPVRPGCDGRPFASPLLRRTAGRDTFFRGIPCRWGLHIALSLIRSISVQVIEACSEENLLDKCSRQCGNTTDLFFTTLWLQQSRSILIQEIQPARNIDMTSFNAFISETTTCYKWCPCLGNASGPHCRT